MAMRVDSTPFNCRPVALVNAESDRDNAAPEDRPPSPAISRLSPLARLRQRPARVDEEAHISGGHPERRLEAQAVASGTARDLSALDAPSEMSTTQGDADSKLRVVKNRYAQDFFARIASNTPCVFLVSGSREKCRIDQIQLRDDDDHVNTLEKMKSCWEGSRVWLPFRQVTRVEEVTFYFLGTETHNGTSSLVGVYEPLDTENLRRRLREELERRGNSIEKWYKQDPWDICEKHLANGDWGHFPDCPSLEFAFCDCVFQEHGRINRHLRRLSLMPMLTLAFRNPSLASGQCLLSGLAGSSGIYSSRNMLQNLQWHNPSIGPIAFNGYKVTEEWEDIKHSALIQLAVTVVTGSCFVFRVVFGDWQTAIGASSLIATLMALVVQWTVYFTRKD